MADWMDEWVDGVPEQEPLLAYANVWTYEDDEVGFPSDDEGDETGAYRFPNDPIPSDRGDSE